MNTGPVLRQETSELCPRLCTPHGPVTAISTVLAVNLLACVRLQLAEYLALVRQNERRQIVVHGCGCCCGATDAVDEAHGAAPFPTVYGTDNARQNTTTVSAPHSVTASRGRPTASDTITDKNSPYSVSNHRAAISSAETISLLQHTVRVPDQ